MIAGDVAALAQHPVARHHEGERILADRSAHGARGLARPELRGDGGISHRPAQRNFEQGLPHPHFKIGADEHDAQRPVGAPQAGVEDACCERRRAGAVFHDIGHRPAASHVGERGLFLAGIGESEPRKSALGRHHQRGAERGRVKAVGYGQPGAAGFPFPRRHRFVGDEEIVQPSRPRETDLERGVEHAGGVPQQPAGMVEGERLQECLGRDPGPAAKQMVEIAGAHAGRCRDGLDFRLCTPALGDERNGAAHDFVVGGVAAERLDVGDAIGREHGCLHRLPAPSRARKPRRPPVFCRINASRARSASARAWPPRSPPRAPARSFPSPAARGSRRSQAAAHARPGTAARCRIPHAPRGRASPRAD